MSKEYFAVDLKRDLSDEVLSTVCEWENNKYLDIITGIDVSSINGYNRMRTRRLSKRSVNFWLKKLTTEDIIKYKDNIIDAKYYNAKKNRKVRTNTTRISYR